MRVLSVFLALLALLALPAPSLSFPLPLPTPPPHNATSSALGLALAASSALASALAHLTSHPLHPRDAPQPHHPPFHHGSCGIHIRQKQQYQGFEADAPRGKITARIASPAGTVIGYLPSTRYTPRRNLTVATGIPDPALVTDDWTPRNGTELPAEMVKDRRLGRHDVAGELRMTVRAGKWLEFELGEDRWRSDDPGRCRVGEWDRTFWLQWDFKNPKRDMDCGFAC